MKIIRIICDQCGNECGTSEHLWWYISIYASMKTTTDYLNPYGFDKIDFCSTDCAIRYLEDEIGGGA